MNLENLGKWRIIYKLGQCNIVIYDSETSLVNYSTDI